MLGDLFDSMQECKDYIETVKLNNPRPFDHREKDEHFAKQVQELLDCHLTHLEDSFTIQLKNIMQDTWKHKDQWNCMWNGEIYQDDSDFILHVG
jgi:hypothetical protein